MTDEAPFGVSRGAYDPSFAFEPGTTDDITAGLGPPALPVPTPSPVAPVGLDETTRKMFVNGSVFDLDDHQSAVESEDFLRRPLTQMPANFRPVGVEEYRGYIDQIKNPSLGRLVSKNVGIGFDVSQQLAGSTLKFFGAEETGQAIVEQQEEDIRRKQPYQRTFTDDAMKGRAGEWFVANAAQLAPLMLELILTSLVTDGVGGWAAGGGLATKGGAFLLRKSGREGAAKFAREGIEKLRGGARRADLTPDELAGVKAAGRAAGATFGAAAASEGVAIGDIYKEVEDSGNYDSPAMARLVTALFSVPYAASEVLPGAAGLVYGMRSWRRGRRGGRLRRSAVGAGVGAGVEGSTEAFQEILAMGAAGELDFHDPEVINRLINSFAAGAGVGAPIGGVVGFVGKKLDIDNRDKEVDLLGQDVAIRDSTDFERVDSDDSIATSEGFAQLTEDRRLIDIRLKELDAALNEATRNGDAVAMQALNSEMRDAIEQRRAIDNALEGAEPDTVISGALETEGPEALLEAPGVPEDRARDLNRASRPYRGPYGPREAPLNILDPGEEAIPTPDNTLSDLLASQQPTPEQQVPPVAPAPPPVEPFLLGPEHQVPQLTGPAPVQQEFFPAAPPVAPVPLPVAPVPEPESFIPSPPGQLELPGSEQLLDQPASATSGPFNIAQSVLTYPGEPTVVTEATVAETGEVVRQEVTVREAIEHSDQRMRSTLAMRACLRDRAKS